MVSPLDWLAKVRASVTTLTARFSANRAVSQYTTEYYVPAAEAYEARQANQGALGIRMANWRRQLEQEWHSISFGDLQIETRDGQHHFQVEVIFGGVDPQAVQVELFAGGDRGPALAAADGPGRQAAGPGGSLRVYARQCRRRGPRAISPRA